jgi:transcription initiation factor IIE alpha subunit
MTVESRLCPIGTKNPTTIILFVIARSIEAMVQGKQTVTDEEITAVMRKSQDPAFTTSELAERLEMSTEGVRRRLNKLREDGRVHRKKPSSRTVIWWIDGGQPSVSST